MITVTRDRPEHYEVLISPLPSRHINKARDILHAHRIPEAGTGGMGYRIGDGELLISGPEVDVYRASTLIGGLVRGDI